MGEAAPARGATRGAALVRAGQRKRDRMKVVKLVLRITLPLTVSVLLMWLSLRHTDLRAVAAAIAAADPMRVLAYLGITLVVHVLRTVRWGILLSPLGHVGWKRLNAAAAVGFMLLMLLPLRLGEFARPLLIANPAPGQGGARIRRSGAMASCVVERVIDGISVGVLGTVALQLASASGKYVEFARKAAVLVALGFGALGVALVAAYFLRPQALRLTRAIFAPVSPRLGHKVEGVLDAFITALHLGSPWKVLAVLLLTCLYWGAAGLGLAILAPAFGMHLAPLMAATVLTIQVVGVMVPAGPGMVGTFQFFTQAGLSLFVAGAINDPVASVHAAAFANTLWLMQFGQQTLLGVAFLLFGGVSLRGVIGQPVALAEAEAGAPAKAPEAERTGTAAAAQ
jgi:uncharacterized protein (TIRG00374 family)